jgi:hypothetical protein
MSEYKELSKVLVSEFNSRLTESGCSGNPEPVRQLWEDVQGTIPWQQLRMVLGKSMIERINREIQNHMVQKAQEYWQRRESSKNIES